MPPFGMRFRISASADDFDVYNCLNLSLAVLGFVAAQAFLVVASGGYSLVVVAGFSLQRCFGAERRGPGTWAQQLWFSGLWSTGSTVVSHGLCCSVWDLPRLGIKQVSPAYRVDSLTLSLQGNPILTCKK